MQLTDTQSLEASQEGGIDWPRLSMKQLWMMVYGPVVGSHAVIPGTVSSKLEPSVLLPANEPQNDKAALLLMPSVRLDSAMRCQLEDSTSRTSRASSPLGTVLISSKLLQETFLGEGMMYRPYNYLHPSLCRFEPLFEDLSICQRKYRSAQGVDDVPSTDEAVLVESDESIFRRNT
jgi:hypothetical protein